MAGRQRNADAVASGQERRPTKAGWERHCCDHNHHHDGERAAGFFCPSSGALASSRARIEYMAAMAACGTLLKKRKKSTHDAHAKSEKDARFLCSLSSAPLL